MSAVRAASSPLPAPPATLCVNGKCTATTTSSTGIKWHPGVIWNSSQLTPANAANASGSQVQADFALLDSVGSNAGVAGLELYADWSVLEGNTAGDYTAGFALIDAYLAKMASEPNPKHMILVINSYQYGSCNGSVPTSFPALPAYFSGVDIGANSMIDVCTGGVANSSRVYTAAIWNPVVTARLIALSAAYAARYNSNPNFEMIQPIDETAQYLGNAPNPSPGAAAIGTVDSGFTFGASVTQAQALYAAMKQQWTQTLVRVPANYLPDYQDSSMEAWLTSIISNYNNGRGLIVGGGDTVPEPTIRSQPTTYFVAITAS